MNRPYYIHTPMNIFGESLVRCDNGVKYSIRSVHDKRDFRFYSRYKWAVKAVEKMNDEHEVLLSLYQNI